MTTTEAGAGAIRSLIPARLDRLSWSPFHTRSVDERAVVGEDVRESVVPPGEIVVHLT
jgi:hypothetical protein